ncbi:MAG TPA: Gfo/Idh/MocA family oxidoreductase [Roseiflexaceae bacterium]|nr:Gfo/Idh/MocA family oxidoreductase [Roseiflexaceae bacterium]
MKVGILSFAHLHAEAYIQNLRAVPDVELIGIADEDPLRGERYAGEFGAHLFGSYDELLAARPDAVLVCCENSRHRALVEQAAAAGAHVLCEKPLATNLADAQAMIAACERAGVQLMTAFPMRFSAPLRAVKARLDAGELGRVYCFNAVNQGQLPMRHRAWFVDPELAGGGAVLDHTVHLADIMRWYLGSEVVEVYAQTNRIMHADRVAVETGGLLLLTFANGVFATIDCSWSRPDGYPTWGGLALELVTERGALSVDAFRQNLLVYGAQRLAWDHWGADANQAMVESFLEGVRTGRPPAVTGDDGAQALAIALAAYESARTGQPAPVRTAE